MKANLLIYLSAILLFSAIHASAQSMPVKVSAASVMLSEKANDVEVWAYKISLQNTGKELTNLVIKHRIYLHHENNPGGRKEQASPISFVEDKQAMDVLKAGATTALTTKGMDFAMDGSGKVKADKDILRGVWVRVFTADGKEVGSFVKPASIAKKMPWQ